MTDQPFHLFSIPNAERAIVSRLLAVQRSKKLRERQRLLAALESEGYTVRFVSGRYEATSRVGKRYALPQRRCTGKCGQWKPLDTFIGVRGVEHPWCAACRFDDYAGAERARAELAYRLRHGQPLDDLLGLRRCGNPACPNGGVIALPRQRRGHTFCSPACREAVATEREAAALPHLAPCANPACPEQQLVALPARFCSQACRIAATYHRCANPACPRAALIAPRRKYCSRACTVEHHTATGRYRALSEQGVSRIADILAVTGEMPHAAERRLAVSQGNRQAPPRRRMVREDTVLGHLVRFLPQDDGSYRAIVDGMPPSVTAVARTKQQARRLVAAAMRTQMRDER